MQDTKEPVEKRHSRLMSRVLRRIEEGDKLAGAMKAHGAISVEMVYYEGRLCEIMVAPRFREK